MANFGWLPKMDNYLRAHYGAQSPQSIARQVTELLAALSANPDAVCTAADVNERAVALGLTGGSAPLGIGVKAHLWSRLRGATRKTLQTAVDPEVQRLFQLLTGLPLSALQSATDLIGVELYSRKNGKKAG